VTPAAREARLWYWQRVSAMVLAICVVVHIVTIVYAVRGGLTGAQILSRTRGSLGFGAFYIVFLAACAVHVPIGLAAILEEWFRLPRKGARIVAAMFAAIMFGFGVAAIEGVVFS
jgi:succinate dehydrogenase subunit C